MQKYIIIYRKDNGSTDTITATSSTPTTEQAVISQFIAKTGYRVIACNRVQ